MTDTIQDAEELALLAEHNSRLAVLPPLTSKAEGSLTDDQVRHINADNAIHVAGVLSSSQVYAKAVLELFARRKQEE